MCQICQHFIINKVIAIPYLGNCVNYLSLKFQECQRKMSIKCIRCSNGEANSLI